MAVRTITIFSNKGGVGKTFVAVNTAAALALAGHKVLVLDLDLQGSQDMARMLNIAPRYSFVDVFPEIEKAGDKFNAAKFVSTHSSGLDYLPLLMNVRQMSQATAGNLKSSFRKLIAHYDYVIVDCGRSFNDVLLAILDMSNLILMVTTPDVLAVYQIKWGMEILHSQHFPTKMLRVVLNRAESFGGVASQEVKAALGVDIIGRIPSDGKAVGIALNRGVPCVVDSPRSRVAQAFNEIAASLEDQSLYIQTTEMIKVRSVEQKGEGEDFWARFGIAEGAARTQIKHAAKKDEDEYLKLKKRIHERLVERMNLRSITPQALGDPEQAAAIKVQAQRIIIEIMAEESGALVSSAEERGKIVQEIVNESLGLGPLEEFLADPAVTDILVNCKDEIYVERNGKLMATDSKFMSDQHVRLVIERVIAPLGRRIDESVPMVDARTPDGSRINAIIPPLSLRGPMITIRKFSQERYTAEDLVSRFKSIAPPMAQFLEAAVISRKNILVSGGTGSGKTTLLNIISHFIPDGQRIITIEDAAELKINKSHWARLESRPPNIEGRGQVTIRDLFVNTLRMRPDRIIIGECRGGEVLDMLQAMNTGHDGSMTTLHANTTHDAITRLNALILLSGVELPLRATYEMIASALQLIVQVSRLSDGSRKVIAITELTGKLVDGTPECFDVFKFHQTGINEQGRVEGYFAATGYVPLIYKDLLRRGIKVPQESFSADKHYPVL